MKRPPVWIVLGLVVALLVGAGAFMFPFGIAKGRVDPAAVTGRWLTESGNLEIDIKPCGERLCGIVATVLDNRSMSRSQQAMTSADGRSPLGMTILSDFADTAHGSWNGRIYNRENGKTYDCLMTLASVDRLEIRGYKVLPLIGKTQIWTRVPQP